MRRLCLCLIATVLAPGLFGFQQKSPHPILELQIENRGVVTIELFSDEAPKTTSRIAALASSGFYDGQKFFKVVRSPKPFLIQTGDPNSRTRSADDPSLGTGGSGQKVPFEGTKRKHVAGAVGLARLPDDPNSGDSQFYIMLAPASFLDGSYCVFGQVTQGLDAVNRVELGDRITRARIVTQ